MLKTKEQIQKEKEITGFERAGKFQKAIEACKYALLKYGTDPALHEKLGDLYLACHLDIYQAKHYIDDAITEYQRATESYIDSAKIFYKLGNAFFYKNEYEKAINYYDIALGHDEKYSDAYYMKAETLTRKGHLNEAKENCRKAIEYAPFKSARARYLLSKLYDISAFRDKKDIRESKKQLLMSVLSVITDKQARREIRKKLSYLRFIPVLIKGFVYGHFYGADKALEVYIRAVEKAPGFVHLYCIIGEIYRLTGRYDEAICEYKMALWLDSMNVLAYRSLCGLYEEIGDYDSAVEIYQKLITIEPYIAEFHSNLANIYYLKGEYKNAVTHYQQAISINPNITWTSIVAQTLGYVFQENLKNTDAAISAYQTAFVLTPKDMDIYINLGSAFYEKEEYDSALGVYRQALELEPHNAKIYCNLGYLYWGKGEIEEAVQAYETAIKYDTAYDIAYNNLGVIYLDDLGRVQKAIEMFENAIENNPNYALAYYNLARSTVITGDKITAAKLYQTAYDLNNITNELDPEEIREKIRRLFD